MGLSYKRNKRNVSGRQDKTYLRNELKLTYNDNSSYIYNTFIFDHRKRRIYFKNIYKTPMRLEQEQDRHIRWAYKRGGGIYPDGLISSLANEIDGLISRG